MKREDVILIFFCAFFTIRSPWWRNAEMKKARKKPSDMLSDILWRIYKLKIIGTTMYGLGRMAKNMAILGTFCRSTWQQKWPPFGHFYSDNLVFWWVSRYGSLTYLCHKWAPHLVWLWKLPARYVKKHDFGIQNGHQAAILDPRDPIFCVQVGPMGIHAHTKFGNSSLYG